MSGRGDGSRGHQAGASGSRAAPRRPPGDVFPPYLNLNPFNPGVADELRNKCDAAEDFTLRLQLEKKLDGVELENKELLARLAAAHQGNKQHNKVRLKNLTRPLILTLLLSKEIAELKLDIQVKDDLLCALTLLGEVAENLKSLDLEDDEEQERPNVCPDCHYDGKILVSNERARELDKLGSADEELCLWCAS